MVEQVRIEPFGVWKNQPINRYHLHGADGFAVEVINYGATITRILVPNRNGQLYNVALGFETLDGYLRAKQCYMGSTCGRYAGRIAHGRFLWADKPVVLSQNQGSHTLHGGQVGFDQVVWVATVLPGQKGLLLRYESADGEQGFPGRVSAQVHIQVEGMRLLLHYTATAEQPTPINLTNHTYFNLDGTPEHQLKHHWLQIKAPQVLATTDELIPTGAFQPVAGSLLDFNTEVSLGGARANQPFDHCYVFNKPQHTLDTVAHLRSTWSGIGMTVQCTHPGMQFYTGQHLPTLRTETRHQAGYGPFAGLCLETQFFPDSPNHPTFPSTLVAPNQPYDQTTVFAFNAANALS